MGLHGNGIVGIRREDKNEWERRCPLAPADVKTLVREGVRIIIQPAPLRGHSDYEYQLAGAEIKEDLSEAGTIIGVKEIPIELLLPEKTYMYFSHTIKAQEAGMPALDTILERKIRLIDYEPIVNAQGQRLVFFGLFAGYAGTIDAFTALGLNLIKRGIGTPFLNMVYSKHYSDIKVARADVELCGLRIRAQGLPKEMGPCVIVVTGNGNSARGAMEICELLAPTLVKASELADLMQNYDPRMVYLCQVTTEDFIVPVDASAAFDKKDYYKNPEKYRCVFEERILPYASLIINCIFWEPKYPRLITKEGIKKNFESGTAKLAAISDISCDINGSIELTTMATTIDHPIFFYNTSTGEQSSEVLPRDRKHSIAVCSIDHLPAELPRSATEFFSNQLRPFLKIVAGCKDTATLPPELAGAVIAEDGKLTPKFEYIVALRKEKEKKLKRVLIFGAGRMVDPVIRYLLRFSDIRITVASMFKHEADALCNNRPACTPVVCSVTEQPDLVSSLVERHSVVVSLLPATLHERIARPCIQHARHLVTASYISESLREMDKAAKDAGIIILGEMGVDPGIDHMSALKMINDAKQAGGKIIGFQSWCGGLPSPQDSDNPFGYKFSWAPRSALAAGKNHAVYLWNGEKKVPAEDLFRSARNVHFIPAFNMEGYPNRDSLSYIEDYGLQGTEILLRGTLRYRGYSKIMYGFVTLGLLDDKPVELLAATNKTPTSWLQAIAHLLGTKPTEAEVSQAIAAKLQRVDLEYTERVLSAMVWLGMLSAKEEVPRKGTYLDALCATMEAKMAYGPNETDLVVMVHSLEVKFPDGKTEQWMSSMTQYGTPNGATAMSITVGLPVAVAVAMILEGRITSRGVIRPTLPEVYIPALELLEKEGIRFKETRRPFFISGRPANFEHTIPVLDDCQTPQMYPMTMQSPHPQGTLLRSPSPGENLY